MRGGGVLVGVDRFLGDLLRDRDGEFQDIEPRLAEKGHAHGLEVFERISPRDGEPLEVLTDLLACFLCALLLPLREPLGVSGFLAAFAADLLGVADEPRTLGLRLFDDALRLELRLREDDIALARQFAQIEHDGVARHGLRFGGTDDGHSARPPGMER